MEEIKPTVITVKKYDGEMSLTIPFDANIEDCIDTFRLILKYMTYSDDSIKEFLPTVEEIEEREKDLVGAVKDSYAQEHKTKKRK